MGFNTVGTNRFLQRRSEAAYTYLPIFTFDTVKVHLKCIIHESNYVPKVAKTSTVSRY
ncbi:hypothetical protein shim_21490 [Shimia sp. SK013]|nr:hypothetical protein shim_21490 [Shimia sp. SK013]